VENVSFEPGMK